MEEVFSKEENQHGIQFTGEAKWGFTYQEKDCIQFKEVEEINNWTTTGHSSGIHVYNVILIEKRKEGETTCLPIPKLMVHGEKLVTSTTK